MIEIFSYNSNKYSYMHYAIAIALGAMCGSFFIPINFVVIIYFVLGLALVFFAATYDLLRVFTWLPYFSYLEIWVKDRASTALPYSFAQFIMIAVFATLLVKEISNIRFHTRIFIFMLLFALVEAGNSVASTYIEYARFLIYNSIYMALLTMWCSANLMNVELLKRFIYNLKVAGIFLCGIIMVVHVNSHITYNLASNFGATNGLAPNQIACYLGITGVFLFLSIMNTDDILVFILNIMLMFLCAVLLALSFSRGGIYMLGVVSVLYLIVNFRNPKTLFFTILIVPLAYGIFLYTSSVTSGMIEKRFELAGTSGRDLLAEAALKLFERNVFTGMGTGNFFNGVAEEHLFSHQSGAHNEFTRVMAEHGILGMIPYYSFYFFLAINIIRRKQPLAREMAFYFFILFFNITIYNALKIAIQPLLLIFVIATPFIYKSEDEEEIVEEFYNEPAPISLNADA